MNKARVLRFFEDYLASYVPYKADMWNYEDGCVLNGCEQMFAATGDARYRDFALSYLSGRVTTDGSIPTYETAQYNIDSINSGRALFFALAQTGEARYREAIEYHMRRLLHHPRCACGGFWHKTIYPWQMWLDGLYMAEPFYARYETRLNNGSRTFDIALQFENVRKHLYNPEKGLCYHGWDEARKQPWCDPETGVSKNFWLRAMGWYMMALADVLEEAGAAAFPEVAEDLSRVAAGILRYADAETGLFYQVIDRADAPGNYTESSGSAMVACALMRGCRIGVLPREPYLGAGIRALESLCELKLVEREGHVRLTDICKVAGLGPGDTRDGSLAYYLSEPRAMDDQKGVGALMMALSEYLRIC